MRKASSMERKALCHLEQRVSAERAQACDSVRPWLCHSLSNFVVLGKLSLRFFICKGGKQLLSVLVVRSRERFDQQTDNQGAWQTGALHGSSFPPPPLPLSAQRGLRRPPCSMKLFTKTVPFLGTVGLVHFC